MQHHIEARYRREHVNDPAILSTVEDIDALIDELLVSPVDQNLAQPLPAAVMARNGEQITLAMTL